MGKVVRVMHGSSISKRQLEVPIERFLSLLRIENRGKLDDLGLEIDTNTLNPVISHSSPFSRFMLHFRT